MLYKDRLVDDNELAWKLLETICGISDDMGNIIFIFGDDED